jgi:hypothetical protein
MVIATPPAALPPGKKPGTHCIGAGWAPGPVWTGAENLASTEIRFADRPALIESLYRLSCRGCVGKVRAKIKSTQRYSEWILNTKCRLEMYGVSVVKCADTHTRVLPIVS